MAFQEGNTFVFGEQPSASKMDQLWRNDDALYNGSFAQGVIDTDRLNTTSAFEVWQSSSTTMSSSTDTKLAWQEVITDVGGDFDFANNEYVAPFAGWGVFMCAVGMSTIADGSILRVKAYVNGSELRRAGYNTGSGNSDQPMVSFVTKLNAGDRVSIYGFQNEGSNANTNSGVEQTWFNGILIGV